MLNLLDLDREKLTAFFAELGEPAFRAGQLLKWIHQQGVLDFEVMTNLSKSLRQQLKETTTVTLPKVQMTQTSQDGTYKWLLQLADGQHIEMVFIPEEDRGTLCVSSQVGCALGCPFCATGQQGFSRNLTTGEIIAQLWLAEHLLNAEQRHLKRLISNVVFMGMGEPLLNFDNVVGAMRLMQDDFCYGLSWRRITLSTVGIVPAVARLKTECPVNLAISLHAPTDALRSQLVPLNKKYPIASILAACHDYVKGKSQRKITFEYVMLQAVNDSPVHAQALVKLLRNLPVKINLIPFNSFSESGYQSTSSERIDQFRDILLQADLVTVTRKTRGGDINAACGQLATGVK